LCFSSIGGSDSTIMLDGKTHFSGSVGGTGMGSCEETLVVINNSAQLHSTAPSPVAGRLYTIFIRYGALEWRRRERQQLPAAYIPATHISQYISSAVSNYRQVSLTCIACKSMEHIIASEMFILVCHP